MRPTNLSNHNSIQLVIDNFQTPINLIDSSCNSPLKQSTYCNWSKATQIHTRNYAANLDQVLQSIDISNDLFTCNDLCCTNATHVNDIDKLSACIVKCCFKCRVRCIPHSGSGTRVVPGWNDHVKHDKDQSLFWHWIWTEAGRPNSGYIYQIMRTTRHRYHYAVRRCRKQKQEHQRSKLAEHFHDPKMFWSEAAKISSADKQLNNIIGNASGPEAISQLFHEKYKTLYNSVPTSHSDLSNIKNTIVERLHPSEVSNLDRVTPELICHCIGKLKPGKGDGSEGFKSDHLINAGNSLNVILSLLFRAMVIHGHYPRNLLVSTIISIPKDLK